MKRVRDRRRRRPIGTRLVLAVSLTMAVVLLLTSGFVFWRVELAMSRQVDEDLDAYRELVESALARGVEPVKDTVGESFQVYTPGGRVLDGNVSAKLADLDSIEKAADGQVQQDSESLLVPASRHPRRVITAPLETPRGKVVVAYAISLSKHDEALRELLLQLAIADLLVLAAAAVVGHRTARAALDPVERYRRAAASAASAADAPLPVPDGDDELTRLGHTLNDLLERIARSNARESQFLADASHELRAPLTVMRTELDLALLRPPSGAEAREAFASLHAQTLRLIDLCNALLELQEVHAHGDSATGSVDLTELCAEVVARTSAEATRLDRRVELVAPDTVILPGRRRWLDLAITNLAVNALRHGAGTVTVSVTTAGDDVIVSVEDRGAGFPPEFVARAFDRFTRADGARSSPGSGLGLALVKAVADAHGGAVDIDGARVSVLLPRRAPKIDAPPGRGTR